MEVGYSLAFKYDKHHTNQGSSLLDSPRTAYAGKFLTLTRGRRKP